ncbi:MAG: anaerobic ribonucleoside-triphosphate reductase activating protein [Candidatus Syntrophonatronum acetioxidans]|uniref:Anaerobic ribonucleoside-triphosphate reductase-activating protein n=1 Tax=Candidatus Syntrophonatronum acetioxidans TaxID=1795816 RepID=A0A424YB98_9FIRM|nr:MAG: anaerobic ribonucleoside-triphosphate reductase activating protein [Candidatus Syntrophonatronum acetioxidans]
MIKFSDIAGESMVDGKGIRVAVFLQGCPRACEGCHNPTLQPAEGGREMEEENFARLLLSRITPLHNGITFSGGEPLMQEKGLFQVLKHLKKENPQLDIWVYTGYTYEEIKDLPLLKLIDVLVDGPFMIGKKDLNLPFRGSSNQRIIDVESSLREGKAVELPEYARASV